MHSTQEAQVFNVETQYDTKPWKYVFFLYQNIGIDYISSGKTATAGFEKFTLLLS